MFKEIKSFLKSNETILILNHTKYSNIGYRWTRWGNPLRTLFNALVIQTSKILPSIRLKVFIYRLLLRMKIGKNVVISPFTEIDPFHPELIQIGDNVLIGWGVKIFTHELTQKKLKVGRVRIGKNSLIGAFSILRCGVSVGKYSLIATGSFVNRDVPDNKMYGGVPVKQIK